jgi:hypothetical protein
MSKVPKGLLAAGFAATLVFAASAVGAPGNGAQVIDYNYCQPDGVNTLCADGRSVYQRHKHRLETLWLRSTTVITTRSTGLAATTTIPGKITTPTC